MSQKTSMGNVDGRELIETSPLFVPISKRVDREKVKENGGQIQNKTVATRTWPPKAEILYNSGLGRAGPNDLPDGGDTRIVDRPVSSLSKLRMDTR